jgi:hypothetical protein
VYFYDKVKKAPVDSYRFQIVEFIPEKSIPYFLPSYDLAHASVVVGMPNVGERFEVIVIYHTMHEHELAENNDLVQGEDLVCIK